MKRKPTPGPDPQEGLFGRNAQGRREGRRRAVEGGALAEDKANRVRSGYSILLEATILQMLSRPGATVTGEEVRQVAPCPEGTNPTCIGPVFTRLAKAGRIVEAGFEGSLNPNRHAAPVRKWRLAAQPAASQPAEPQPAQVGPTVDDLVRDDLPPLDGFDVGGES